MYTRLNRIIKKDKYIVCKLMGDAGGLNYLLTTDCE